MLLTLILFLGSAIAIYLACEYFVNAIEWCGKHMNLGATAVGSVLAAFGTALPESAVTFTAVVFGHTAQQKDIGVGAAMGGPLVLATIAYGVVGLALWLNQKRLKRAGHAVEVDHKRLGHDQLAFLAIFAVKVTLGLVVFTIKPWLGILFLAAYAIYVWREITAEETGGEEEELEPLKDLPRQSQFRLGRSAGRTGAGRHRARLACFRRPVRGHRHVARHGATPGRPVAQPGRHRAA